MDERDEIGADQQAAVTAHQTYSVYEPHYQQMHPLIYYEDPTVAHHGHPHILAPAVAHHWDQEQFVHMPMIPFGDTSARACLHSVGFGQPTVATFNDSTELTVTGPASVGRQVTNSPLIKVRCETVDGADQQQQHRHHHQQQRQQRRAQQQRQNQGHHQQHRRRRRQKEQERKLTTNRSSRRQERGASRQTSGAGPVVSRDASKDGSQAADQDPDGRVGADACLSGRQSCGRTPVSSPHPSNRAMHNEIERRRRLRIKQCCDILQTQVPGLTDKTDKATVLEHTVKFVTHLVKCPDFKCNCQFKSESRQSSG